MEKRKKTLNKRNRIIIMLIDLSNIQQSWIIQNSPKEDQKRKDRKRDIKSSNECLQTNLKIIFTYRCIFSYKQKKV